MNITLVPVSQLKANTYNPNQQSVHDFDLLVKSIQEDGFTLPVVVNDGSLDPELTDMIIDGEHRWRAAQVLAMEAIPVIYKGMDKAAMRVSTIRHNQARGSHDAVMEARLITDLAGSVSKDELMAQLNLDEVELDVLRDKAVQYDDQKELASMLVDGLQDDLEEAGVPAGDARIVAQRHAMIDSKGVLKEQDRVQGTVEAFQNVRFEFVYSGEQADFMREQVRSAGGALKLLLRIRGATR